MLIKSSDEVNDQLDISADNLDSMKMIADQLDVNSLIRYIRVFSELSNQIRYSTQKRVVLELAVIKLTTPQMETNLDSILDRLRVLENKVEEGAFSLSEEQLAALSARQSKEQVITREEPQIDREEILKKELTPAEVEDMQRIMESIEEIKRNPELCGQVGVGTMNLLRYASINVGYDHKSIILSFGNDNRSSMGYDQFQKEEHRKTLQEVIGELTGKKVEITCQMKDTLEERDLNSVNLSKVNFPIKMME